MGCHAASMKTSADTSVCCKAPMVLPVVSDCEGAAHPGRPVWTSHWIHGTLLSIVVLGEWTLCIGGNLGRGLSGGPSANSTSNNGGRAFSSSQDDSGRHIAVNA